MDFSHSTTPIPTSCNSSSTKKQSTKPWTNFLSESFISIFQKFRISSRLTPISRHRLFNSFHPSLSYFSVLKFILFFLLPVLSAQSRRKLTQDPAKDLTVLDLLWIAGRGEKFRVVDSRQVPRVFAYRDTIKRSAGSEKKAVNTIRVAAKGGDLLARVTYGCCLWEGYGVPKDMRKGGHHFKIAANQGSVEGQILYGYVCVAKKKDLSTILKSWRRAARQKDPSAEYLCGYTLLLMDAVRHPNLKGFDPAVIATAIKYIRRSARQGSQIGEAAYGLCYAVGLGVEKDEKKALKYLQQSAEKGDAGGQFLCGWLLQQFGGKKNLRKAAKYYKMAADKGSGPAECSYGWMLENGLGVKRSIRRAYQYYKSAVDHGYERAKPGLNRCEKCC
jgi:TPR repeat protein